MNILKAYRTKKKIIVIYGYLIKNIYGVEVPVVEKTISYLPRKAPLSVWQMLE